MVTVKRFFVVPLLLCFTGVLIGDTGARHQRRQNRPVKLGTSGGNNRDITTEFCCSGTLGALVKDRSGVQYVLSNNHVIGLTNDARAGQDVGQPGLIDAFCRVQLADPIAHFTRLVPIRFGRANRVDAAIARVVSGSVNRFGRILDIGKPGAPIAPRIGMRVKKSGRTSGKTVGRIIALNTTVRVAMPRFCGDEKGRIARFVDQIVVETTNQRAFTESGDSGSLIVTRKRTCPRSVGLLFAADDQGVAIANRIQDVLSALNVSIVGCAGASATEAEAQGSHFDPAIRKIEAIRQRNEDRFLKMTDVVGIGVGRNEQPGGSYDIVLFVKKSVSVSSFNAIPTHIEGVPVRIRHTSGFVAK